MFTRRLTASVSLLAAHWGHHLESLNKINAKFVDVRDRAFTGKEENEDENSINNRRK